MGKLKKKRYIALLLIVVLFIALIGMLSSKKYDKDAGLVKITKAYLSGLNTKLKTSVIDASTSSAIESKGYDEINYVVNYTLSTDESILNRPVTIIASLDENERFAFFKEINKEGITSTLSSNMKEIEVHIANAKVGEENSVTLKMVIQGAPNGYRITPNIIIKEDTETEFSSVLVNDINVNTNSLSGKILDDKGMPVSNILIGIYKDEVQIREVYTKDDGLYVFSDLAKGQYEVKIDEDIYKSVNINKINVEGTKTLNITVKQVEPYQMLTRKYISKVTLNNDGTNYLIKEYEKKDIVQESVQNLKNLNGEIEYKIIVQNVGEKSGTVTVVKDELPEGLNFNEKKNSGWELKDGIIYNRSLEGITLEAGEKREEKLILDIINTNEAKTYINKITALGEIYERVSFILDNELYKEFEVLEGELVRRPETIQDVDGWYTDSNYTNKYNFNTPVTKDLILYAKTGNIYQVKFYDKDPETGEISEWDEQTVDEGELLTPPEEPTHTGYTFSCWEDEDHTIWDFSNPVTDNLNLTSCYTINSYSVKFIDNNEVYDEQTINYKGSIVRPEDPSKEHYNFLYWSLSEDGEVYDLTTRVTNNVTLYSVYEKKLYNVKFIDNGEIISDEDVEAGTLIQGLEVSKEGYTFRYWKERGKTDEFDFSRPIFKNTVLDSVYEVINYRIEYRGITETEKEQTNNPNTYTIEDNIVLRNVLDRKDEDEDVVERFVGWKENDETPSLNKEIPQGSTGNKEFTAVFVTVEPDVYQITYDLKGGVLSSENPSTYTKKTETFTLNNPSKRGYTFDGWTGSNGTTPNENVTVPKGSTGNKNFISNYTAISYNIELVNSCGEVTNPSTYTIESNDITINNPSKNGYAFTGWVEEGSETKVINLTIPQGSIGNKKYTATCEPIVYNISYVLNGGTVSIENPSTYTVETESFTLNNPSKPHYTFTGWTGSNGTTPNENVTIAKGSTGDKTFNANYQIITHNVKLYDKNPETEELTLWDEQTVNDGSKVQEPEEPTHAGYTFSCWEDENHNRYDFNSEVTTDLVLTSCYIVNKYNVIFIDNNLQYDKQVISHNAKATRPENPSKAHNIFLGWTLNNEIFDFDTNITSDITLYSKYEEVVAPTISHTPTEWTNGNVTVTITPSKNEYETLYKINDGEYQEYSSPITIEENCTVVAKSIKNEVESVTTSHVIDNIDKIIPAIRDLSLADISMISASINITSKDNESGMKEVKVYKDNLYVSSIYYNEDYTEEKTSRYLLTGLEEGTTYNIKVVAIDVAGNISEEEELEIRTNERVIVARIIGENNALFEDPDDYIEFTSLREAIEYEDCVSAQCTIQMVTNTSESVEILDGQDITLDLNGKTVSGIQDTYTIYNLGNFVLLDEASVPGGIINNYGVALLNDNTLSLGIMEDGSGVSVTAPSVYGLEYGVFSNNIFNFYDGKIESRVAIQGEVTETPFGFNANVASGDTQVATLKLISDPEARIKSVYYTQVANAVVEAKNGNIVEETNDEEKLIDSFDDSEYFENFKKEEDGTLRSTNNMPSTEAATSTTIDLRNSTKRQYLKVEYEIVNGGASVVIVEPNDKTNKNIINEYHDEPGEYTTTCVLTPGVKYIVDIHFTNPYDANEEENENQMIIKKITLADYIIDSINAEVNNTGEIVEYGFDYDPVDKALKSNNQYVPNSVAFSYLELDLRNETGLKDLIIRTTLESYGNYGSPYAAVKLVENNDYDLSSSPTSDNAIIYMSGYGGFFKYGPRTYKTVIEAGKKYYLQFYFFKYSSNVTESDFNANNNKDQFTINSIDLIDHGADDFIDMAQYISKAENAEYGFTPNSYGTYYNDNSDSTQGGTTAHSVMHFDLRNSSIDKTLGIYISASKSNFNVYVSESPTDYLNDSTLVISAVDEAIGSDMQRFIGLEKGKNNYVHFVYVNEAPTSYTSISISSPRLIDGENQELNISGSFNGRYNNSGLYNTTVVSGKAYDSYMEIDLRDKTTDYVLKLDAYLQYYSEKIVYLTSIEGTVNYTYLQSNINKTLLEYGYNQDSYNGRNVRNYDQNYEFVLTKGNKYYLHFLTYGDPSKTSYTDSFVLGGVILRPINSSLLNIGDFYVFDENETITGGDADLPDGLAFDTDLVGTDNLRFVGSSPNNYISFNNELWRIIGVFSTEDENGNINKRLKIIRNDMVEATNWDVSDETNGYTGINEWSQSDLMKLLNPGYDDNQGRVAGQSGPYNETVDNSLYWNRTSGNCYNGGPSLKTCDFTSTGLTDEAKTFIDKVKWYTGALNVSYNTLTPVGAYNLERGTATGKDNISSQYADYDNVPRTTSWFGKVGLLYVSDYALASGDSLSYSYTRSDCMNSPYSGTSGACISSNNWLFFTNMPFYSITPTNGAISPSTTALAPYFVLGFTGTTPYVTATNSPFYVRPVVYLSTRTSLDSGNGSYSSPYTISLLDEDNPKTYYNLINEGEDEEDPGEINVIIYEEPTGDYNRVRNREVFGFTYDEESNIISNNNKNNPYSIAAGYVKIDLTRESEPTTITLTIDKISSNQNRTSNGYYNIARNELIRINYRHGNANRDFYDKSITFNVYSTDIHGEKRNFDLDPGYVYYIQYALETFSVGDVMNISIGTDPDVESLVEKEDYTKYNRYLNYDGEIDTIQILKNITLESPLYIPNNKETILDLNGYTLSSRNSDYIITNDGELTIIDSKFENGPEIARQEYERQQAIYDRKYARDLKEYNENRLELVDFINEKYDADYTIDNIDEALSDLGSNFEYTGDVQTFTAPASGKYKLEVWGAQGGYRTNASMGGKGGYASGVISLNEGEQVFVYVGGSGNTGGTSGGFNGGGSRPSYNGGGGATDIRVEGDTLYHRILVAGGGGSDGAVNKPGKAGGGLSGVSATESYGSGGDGGTQTYGNAFGQGGSGVNKSGGYGGAGGGGWFGGRGSTPDGSGDDDRGGGGGSGFAYDGTNSSLPSEYAVTSHVLTSTSLIAGNESTMPNYDGTMTMTGNSGNGYAKIQIIAFDDFTIMDEPVHEQAEMETDFTLKGTISVTTGNGILNNGNAFLDIRSAIINVVSEYRNGIENYGTLLMETNAIININARSATGVYETKSGDILYGDATFNIQSSNSCYGIYIRSNKYEAFGGYKFNGYSTPIYSDETELVLSDITISHDYASYTSIDASSDNRVVLDNVNASSIVNLRNTNIRNSNIHTLNILGSMSYHESKILNSTFTNINNNGNVTETDNVVVTNYLNNNSNGKFNFNNSTSSYYTFNCGIFNSNNSTYQGFSNLMKLDNNYCNNNLATIDNSIINNRVYNDNNLIIKDTQISPNATSISSDAGIINGSFEYYPENITYREPHLTLLGNVSISHHNVGILNIYSDVIPNNDERIKKLYRENIEITRTFISQSGYATYYNTTYTEYDEMSDYNIYFTIGSEDETNNSLVISDATYGIVNNGRVDFRYLSGTISGTNSLIESEIDYIPEGYELDITSTGTNQIFNLVQSDSVELNDVASIGGTTYGSLESAIAAVPEDGSETIITIINDITSMAATSISSNKNIVINLNGHKIKSYNAEGLIINNGTLKLTDTSSNKLTSNIYGKNFIRNNGTLIIDDMIIEASTDYSTIVSNYGTLTINSGSLTSNPSVPATSIGGYNYYIYKVSPLIDNFGGTVNIEGGNILASNSANKAASLLRRLIRNVNANENEGILNINGGVIKGLDVIYNKGITNVTSGATIGHVLNESYNTYTYLFDNSGTLNVNGGTYSLSTYSKTYSRCLNNASLGTANIKNMQCTNINTNSNLRNSGTVVLENSNFNSIYNSGGDIEIKSGEYNGTITTESGTLVIRDGSFTNSSEIINSTGSVITIEHGSLVSSSAPAVRLQTTASTLTIGIKGDVDEHDDIIVSTDNPTISGRENGVLDSVNSTINFYDGVITGTLAINGNVDDIEEGYEIVGTESRAYLGILPIVRNASTEIEYLDIQEAINAATSADTLVLLRNYKGLTTANTFNLESGKEITLDLNGYNMTKSNQNLFNIDGVLKIVNSDDKATIRTFISGAIFVVSGELDIDGDIKIEDAGGSIFSSTGTLKTKDVDLIVSPTSEQIYCSNVDIPIIANGPTYIENGTITSSLPCQLITSNNILSIKDTDITQNYTTVYYHYENVPSGYSNDGYSPVFINNTGNDSNLILNNTSISRTVSVNYGYRYDNNFYLLNAENDVVITNGTFNSTYDTFVKTLGNVTIDGANITARQYGVYTKGNVDIKNTTITSNGANVEAYGPNTNVILEDNTFTSYGYYSQRSYNDNINYITSKSAMIFSGSNMNVSIDGGTYNVGGYYTGVSNDGVIYNNSTNGIVNILSGEFINNYGNKTILYSRANSTTNIGEKDGIVSIENPLLQNTNSGYAIKGSGNVNFYDGIIKTKESSIISSLNEVETGYNLSGTDIEKYLSSDSIIKNITQDKNYTSITEAFDEANNNDELQLLKETILVNSEKEIEIDKTLILDLNGKSFNNLSFNVVSSGNLTINDSTETYDSNNHQSYITSSKLNIIDNKGGTVTINNGNMTLNNSNSSSATIINNGSIDINSNYGSLTINRGILNTRFTNNTGATFEMNNGSIKGFTNNGTATINGGTVSDDSNIRLIENASILNINGGTYSHEYDVRATIDSEQYQDDIYMFFNSSGTINISGNINIREVHQLLCNLAGLTINIINATFINGTSGGIERLGVNYGTLNIDHSSIDLAGSGGYTRINWYGSLYNNGNLTIDNSIFYKSSNSYDSFRYFIDVYSGTATISNSTFTYPNAGENNYAIRTDGSVTFINNTFNAKILNRGGARFISGSYDYLDNSSIGIILGGTFRYILNSYTLVLGTNDGVVDTTSPVIDNSQNGLGIESTAYSKIEFYDGVIRGKASVGSYTGLVSEVPAGYRVSTVTDHENDVTTSTLAVIGEDDARIAVVNRINFDRLQAAINYAAANPKLDGTYYDIILYADIVLDTDLTLTDGITINIDSNGHTFTNPDNYVIPSGLVLDNNPITGVQSSISSLFASIFGMDIDKNITITEMEDGTKLRTDRVYKLYKLEDNAYEIVKMDREEEIGRYKSGNSIEELRTVRSRIYISNLSSGHYKLVDNIGTELSFSISDEGVVSDNIIDGIYDNSQLKVKSSSLAKLIITIRTGIFRSRLAILIISILIVISLLIISNKRQKKSIKEA